MKKIQDYTENDFLRDTISQQNGYLKISSAFEKELQVRLRVLPNSPAILASCIILNQSSVNIIHHIYFNILCNK